MLKKLLVCYCIGFSVLIANAFDSYTDALIAGQEKIKAKNLTEAANAYFSFGETPRNNKMRNEAIEAYAKGVALETAPEDIRVLMQTRIDATYFELGKGDEAITEYKKTFTLTKTAPRYFHDVRIGIAYILCQRQEYGEAIKLNQKITAAENVYAPYLNKAQFTIGQCYYKLGDMSKAKAAFGKIFILNKVDAPYKKKAEDMITNINSEK